MKLKNVLFKAIIGQILIDILVTLTFYNLIPNLLSYTPYAIEEYNFIKQYSGISYTTQALSMFLPYMFIMTIVILIYLKDMIIYRNNSINELSNEKKQKLNTRLLNTPLICYIIKLFAIPTTILITSLAASANTIILTKLTFILTLGFILDGAFTYIYMKTIFKPLISKSKKSDELLGVHISLKKEVFIQFMSILCASLTFMLMLAYSRIIEEKGDAIYYAMNDKLSTYFNNTDMNIIDVNQVLIQIKEEFKYNELNDTYVYFCIEPNSKLTVLDNKILPEFTEKMYIPKMVEIGKNRIYSLTKESQGIIEVINTDNGQYIYGIFFSIFPFVSVQYFLYATLIILIITILVILFYSSNLSKNISEVSSAIETLASGNEVDYDKKLSVTSNDEIGELVIAFNKILELEKENMESKEKNQEIMVEQERLSSLGQLIGGIAHNLKTPIMSIAGVVEAMTDLIKEYDESIDDQTVTHEDHHEIAKDMQNWIDKVRPYLSYMSEVIDTVKGQAVSMNASTMTNFTAKELMLRSNILLKSELKRRHCNLNLDMNINENSLIAGEISAIIQVLDNLIINSMDAYEDNGGDIDVKVTEDDTKVYITLRDYGCGIPENVQQRLFKEMVTSKGKNGTGLGLYMSFSTIKGKFKGDIRYETEAGKGTTFFIELPKYLGE